MKITFLGTGEAFDEEFLNNSSLVQSEKTNFLLDCGLSTPFQLWKYNGDQNLLDAVFISHCHADHYFGFPSLINRMREEGRKKDLTVFSQKGNSEIIKKIIDLGYKNLLSRVGFKINFVDLIPSDKIIF
jgi:ribonuclease Z